METKVKASPKVRHINNGPVVREEKETVAKMIHLYCRKKHHSRNELCNECKDLLNYAHKRLSLCPFGEKKEPVPTVTSTVICRNTETESGQSCVTQENGCFFIIRFTP